jgi:hypothetical protein
VCSCVNVFCSCLYFGWHSRPVWRPPELLHGTLDKCQHGEKRMQCCPPELVLIFLTSEYQEKKLQWRPSKLILIFWTSVSITVTSTHTFPSPKAWSGLGLEHCCCISGSHLCLIHRSPGDQVSQAAERLKSHKSWWGSRAYKFTTISHGRSLKVRRSFSMSIWRPYRATG